MSKVWFITGTSKGFGRVWAQAALKRGDRVAATARDASTLDGLVEEFGESVLPLSLDVTDRTAIDAAVAATVERFGRIDVAINNAGYGLFGMIEEISEAEARAQLETNVFGALWVTQAVLPTMRAQGSGNILQVSSIGGVNAFAGIGLYHASKWALEGFSQSLAAEVKEFGIHVTLIEPAGYATDWGGPSSVHASPLPAYAEARERMVKWRKERSMKPGDPEATGEAILAVVDAEEPPLRLFLGEAGLPMTRAEYERRLAEWEAWNHVAVAAQGEAVQA
ncbi:MAG: SDR family oxidoreductase [Solirubrobacteraceae bacterium]|nr:SDR family oxidoreductase [Solirubrobacteraceae bacterium]